MNLKKIFKSAIFLCSIFIMTIFCISSANAATESFMTRAIRDSNGNVRFKYSNYGKPGANFVKIIRISNNELGYCIEPGASILDFSEGNYNYTTNYSSIISISSLTVDKIKKLKLLSFYGYGYGNHTDDSWYVSTQMEIWETISPGCCTISSGDVNLINNQRQEIRNLMNNTMSLPNFENSDLTQIINQETEYVDINNVLSNYKVTGCTNCTAKIVGNKLLVNSNMVGKAKVNISRTVTNVYNPSILYYNGSYQKVMQFGMPDPVDDSIVLNVIGGTIKVQKIDSFTGSNNSISVDATLEGAEYSVYDKE